jgi:hypothetical protein
VSSVSGVTKVRISDNIRKSIETCKQQNDETHMGWGVPEDSFIVVSEKDSIRIGTARQSNHPDLSDRLYVDPNTEHILGVKGEMAFSLVTGLPMDLNIYANGDKGIDFMTPFGNSVELVTLDVKGAVTPFHLLVKSHEIERCAEILVQSRVEGNKVWLIGWEHKCIMERMPTRDFGCGIISYYRHFTLLRPMSQLLELIKMGQKAIAEKKYQEDLKKALENRNAKEGKIV